MGHAGFRSSTVVEGLGSRQVWYEVGSVIREGQVIPRDSIIP